MNTRKRPPTMTHQQRAESPDGIAMLQKIQDETDVYGWCNYSSLMPDDPDWCKEGPVFHALWQLDLVDTDLAPGGTDQSGPTAVKLTEKGRELLYQAKKAPGLFRE